ncbi:hypothetical protein LCGC14_1851340 [marine sediment metagenome]|uniref:Uncharacterized protein n=1 Tax=marine sediment metagenome TaxID=412755 RepID=A0A0F9GAM9_9ZZZZ
MKLTKAQNKVINALQNGWILITDADSPGATCAKSKEDFEISNTIFFNILSKKLIHQQLSYPFDYVLSIKGKEIKTKNVN